MNDAERASVQRIVETLGHNPAFREIDDNLFIVKQGSAYVMIHVVATPDGRAVVRCAAQLVAEATLTGEIALELLRLNSQLRFGAFAWAPQGKLVFFIHSILGGQTLDSEELTATVRDVAILADHYDDWIAQRCGGKRMQDLLHEQALGTVLRESGEADVPRGRSI